MLTDTTEFAAVEGGQVILADMTLANSLIISVNAFKIRRLVFLNVSYNIKHSVLSGVEH